MSDDPVPTGGNENTAAAVIVAILAAVAARPRPVRRGR